MPVPAHVRGVKGDECQCGRRTSVRHCPACGSSRTYGYAQEQWHQKIDGTMEKVQLFRCISCAHKFTDAEREFCEAPPITTALAAQKLKAIKDAREQGEYLNSNDAKIAQAFDELTNPIVQSDEQKLTAHKNLVNKIRNSYVDNIAEIASKSNRTFQQVRDSGEITESMEDYVERMLKELGAVEPTIKIEEPVQEQEPPKDTALERFKQDAEDARNNTSIAERSLQLEWANLSLAGRAPTRTPAEYVKRRLAGEIFS